MLDSDTKRRIDTARDILVGKVPDPKSQVEQITIALIYKFMDDMDAESEELGGKRKFFTGAFARYGWAKLMRSGLGGHETLALYGEGITKMTENPGLPPLFRDIFKNAYLPYRDPETLKAFLKIIDEFAYDHSERLGDAFEYLLSVLGSQGDAGQFRTPRHIIDFIVELVAPQKGEAILDPACGTAGFLISAYKHILRANTDARGHSRLTPDERGRLAKNFKGYDISPDMVRLSLVNLYLHGFTDPHIYEYDTLTSEERWGETADVILANPPFMSPKGGIKPHKRFTIQAKRSEVLFVDYMAEHLTPSGRAGIIVPEGIIFQSQTAYTALRKSLVETALVAVVSLPAGCFNPYSGVKTSILILDKSLAKRASTIAFFKVENDGYGLGAQRRAIEQNDLPAVQAELAAYLAALRRGESAPEASSTSLVVPKAKIAANGDYNLSGERYREAGARAHRFPLVKIGDVCAINPSKNKVMSLEAETRVSFVPMADLGEHRIAFCPSDEKTLSEVGASYTYFEDGDVLLAKVTPCFENGKAGIARGLTNGIGFGSSEFYVLRSGARVLPEWVYFCVMHPLFRDAATAQMTGTGGLQRVPRGYVENFQIPLPPLEVQKEIVAEIEGYQAVIDGARAVLDHYRPHIPIDPAWPLVELGDIADVKLGKMLDQVKHQKGVTLPYLRNVSIRWGTIDTHDLPEMYFEEDELDRFGLRSGDVLVCEGGEPGRAAVWDGKIPNLKYQKALHRVRFKVPFEPSMLVYLLQEMALSGALVGWLSGTTIKHLTLESFNKLPIPLPPLATQRAIVTEIEAEQKLVAANRELIERFEKKIQATLARIWGEETPAALAR
jgi:type I restriction enzyme M protein